MFRFSTIVLMWGGLTGSLNGCVTRGLHSTPIPEVSTVQKGASAQQENTQQNTGPASLETFSAYLDRG